MTQTETQLDATADPRYASAADTDRYGVYRINQTPEDLRPIYRFTGRVVAPEPGVEEAWGEWSEVDLGVRPVSEKKIRKVRREVTGTAVGTAVPEAPETPLEGPLEGSADDRSEDTA